jgi:leucyl-tRNA synthetase
MELRWVINMPKKTTEVVDEMKIKDQNDPRLEEATQVVYRKEFHSGVLKDNCMVYSGKRAFRLQKDL